MKKTLKIFSIVFYSILIALLSEFEINYEFSKNHIVYSILLILSGSILKSFSFNFFFTHVKLKAKLITVVG